MNFDKKTIIAEALNKTGDYTVQESFEAAAKSKISTVEVTRIEYENGVVDFAIIEGNELKTFLFTKEEVDRSEREEILDFIKWYKNSVPIGTLKTAKQLVSEYYSQRK